MNETEQIDEALPSALPAQGRKPKSPGRVAAARRLNELGLRGPGGRMPVHGLRALETMLARGQEPPGMIGQLLAHFEREFLSDLGGPEDVSSKERALCRRLAELELLIGLVKARLTTTQGGPRRLPWARERDLLTVHARLADSFTRTASALGLQRREKPVPSLEDWLAEHYPAEEERDDGSKKETGDPAEAPGVVGTGEPQGDGQAESADEGQVAQ